MIEHLPALLVVIPLVLSVIILFIAYISARLLRWTAISTTVVLVLLSILTLVTSVQEGALTYAFGGWLPPWGIAFIVDPMSAFIVLVTNVLFTLAVLYGGAYLYGMHWLRTGCYYSLFFLMVAGMSGMLISADLFNIFVFMEMSSLATYVLIAFAGTRANFAAFRYLIIGTLGAKFYLLAVAYIYGLTGSLYFLDVAERLQPYEQTTAMIIIMLLIVAGFGLKMALFPMHGWLPDAHTYAPSTISAMISGVMIKVPAFVLFKIFFFVLGVDQFYTMPILMIAGILAAAGMIVGSVMALLQKECKRMLAYSSVAQIGYVILGFSIGNVYGVIGGLLHIVNHAVMKSCLFFVAGAVKWHKQSDSIDNFKGLGRSMPLSMAAFTVAAFSMIGLPPTAGFFSKWYLLKGAVLENLWFFVIVIVISSLLNAIYFFRIIEKIYLQDADEVNETKNTNETSDTYDTNALQKQSISATNYETSDGNNPSAFERMLERQRERVRLFQEKRFGGFELPLTMLVPIVILAIGVFVLGIYNQPIVTNIIETALGGIAYGR
ncbi:complex I subunit 5 family protein [Desulfuribacillus alkaliarsenatis]|uniref:NADH:quinone oxidoreductase/Mrp antiporter transmembrane domain-containing protein n=1 Tax=Desulfuribacillus alkaliarsenatis TaxID=766136 RepID=A0A1E5G4C3_9FIRM|nr:monovalent cation/H+ antiporter subunit D family protein [Desulfuribacillus alkaliarsenatis]OEF97864.1 hypothetical protein BHF68_13635 [Desulfuribacillus alkaliarsenatis]